MEEGGGFYIQVFIFGCDPWLGFGYYWSTHGNHVAWSCIHAIGRGRGGGREREGGKRESERERDTMCMELPA